MKATLVAALVVIFGVSAVDSHASAQPASSPATRAVSPTVNSALTAGVDPKTMDYAQLGSNTSGRALYTLKNKTSAHAALVAALVDLQKLIGATPTVAGSFIDKTSDRGGGANFTAVVNGTSLQGSVLVGVNPRGTAVSILYAVANAPAEDWAQLLADLPASIKLTDTPFGDGAGTIGLPEGWTIKSSDNTGTVVAAGPNEQSVIVNLTILVLAPNSQGAVQQAQLARMATQFGHEPPPPKPVSAYLSPDKAMESLTKFASNMAVARGQPAEDFKTLLSYKPVQASSPGAAETGLVVYRTTRNTPGNPTDRRYLMMAVSHHLPAMLQGDWGLTYSGICGPEKTFDRDLPTMIAIWNSYKPDMGKIADNGLRNIVAMQQQFQSFMANLKATEDATNQFVNQLNEQSLAADRNSADMDEVIRGYRKVYDTHTGDEADVNLADSTAIVNALNENDPHRYIEIPLRDEVQPLFRQ